MGGDEGGMEGRIGEVELGDATLVSKQVVAESIECILRIGGEFDQSNAEKDDERGKEDEGKDAFPRFHDTDAPGGDKPVPLTPSPVDYAKDKAHHQAARLWRSSTMVQC